MICAQPFCTEVEVCSMLCCDEKNTQLTRVLKFPRTQCAPISMTHKVPHTLQPFSLLPSPPPISHPLSSILILPTHFGSLRRADTLHVMNINSLEKINT